MPDYQPLDLSSVYNAGVEVVPSAPVPEIGARTYHGLPFRVGDDPACCLLALGGARGRGGASIPVGATARNVVFAHRLLESDLAVGGMIGRPVATYTLVLADGRRIEQPVRERFEIATVPVPWGELPFRAWPDQKNRLIDRYSGPWEQAGRRQTGVVQAMPASWWLAVVPNPAPDVPIAAIEIAPSGPLFVLGAVTLGHLDEEPFPRQANREVKITLTREEDAARPFALDVTVDRGTATYPYALPAADAERFLADPLRGWGEPQNPASSPAYVEIAASPSATVTVKAGDEALGAACWGDVQRQGAVDASPRVRLELLDRGRNWVHTTVVDDETGRPVPCRIHFRSPEGIPYQPHGHHNHLNGNNGTWHIDVGGDLRLGQITYAYIDGKCQGWLPRGDVIVDVARGFEYEPLRARVQIAPGQRELTLRLKRWTDMNASRWFSGDTHVHFLSTQGAHVEAQAEDLNVVNLHLSQWGSLFTNTEEFIGRPTASNDGKTIVYASQENRQHILGHMILLGLKAPVMPWCSDGPSEAELGGALEITLADWADQCHAQGGHVVLPHFPQPNGSTAALIATGRVDAVEMTRHELFSHADYYRYLNGGYRVPLVGGTDKMSGDVPVGLYRTYVRIPDDREFGYEEWCRNLALGRTFLSSGPMLRLTVEGQTIGDTLFLPGNGGTVHVEAEAESALPIHRLEIVQHGRVVASTEVAAGTRRLSLREPLSISSSTWLAARVSGPGYFGSIPHRDVWQRGIFAHTSPVYVACGQRWDVISAETAQYMLTMIDGALSYIRERAARYEAGSVTHPHGGDDHAAYLERPYLEAREAIHRRLHAAGLAH